ncbi:MAG: hypothetical protein QM775_22265 [Pirellulales bacterium]
METFIVADDASMIESLRKQLQQHGIGQSNIRVASSEKAASVLAAAAPSALIFVHVSSFQPEEIRLVRQLCAGVADRRRVVCFGPARNAKVIVELMRDGVYDFLVADSDEELRTNLSELLQRFFARQAEQRATGKLLSVIGACGGAGASVIACNVAVAVAGPQRPCMLVDLDISGGVLALLLNASPRYTIASLAGKAEQLDAALFDRALLKQDSGIHLLAARNLTPKRAITKELLQKVIQLAVRSAPVVVVDLKSVELAEQVRLLPLCDRIVLPLRPDYVSLHRTKKNLEFLQRAKFLRTESRSSSIAPDNLANYPQSVLKKRWACRSTTALRMILRRLTRRTTWECRLSPPRRIPCSANNSKDWDCPSSAKCRRRLTTPTKAAGEIE